MLRKISLVAFAVLFALSVQSSRVQAQTAAASCKLVVHVSGFRNLKGDAGATLFNSPNGWPEDNDKALRHGPFPIDPATRTSTVTFDDLAPGTYSFAVIHDENQNHKMDYNMFHIPKEGFGFSNNPHVMLSAPSYTTSNFNITCPVTEISIALQYK